MDNARNPTYKDEVFTKEHIMKSSTRILSALIITVILCGTAVAQGHLTDPYEILSKNFDAQGGLERLKAEKSAYIEGTLALAGLTGTLKVWTQYPDLQRTEVDLTVLKITQGDNGTYTWILDSNGKLQKMTKEDEITTQRRELKRHMADFEYADRKSNVFSVKLGGKDKVNDHDCYVVVITNKLNSDTLKYYINTTTFLVDKSSTIQGTEGTDSFPADYRQIDGVTVPFYTKEVARLTGQAQELTISNYVSNPVTDPARFEPPEEKGKDFSFTTGDRSENIPFQFVGAHLFIPVVVGCKERLWVLDTGAGMTVISKKFAAELGLKTEGDMQGSGVGGNVGVSFATLPAYSIKGIEFSEQKVAVIDMDALNRMVGFEMAGILGFDFWSRFVTKIDYANELVSFYDPETFKYSGDGTPLDVHIKDQVFEVSASLDGRQSGTWLFDVGATGVSLETPYATREGYVGRKGVVGLGAGAGATFELKNVKCDSMQLAGFTVYQPRVSFIPDDSSRSVADKLGGLGNTLFRNFVVYCDYKNERVVLEKGTKFNQPWPEDRSGLQLMVSSDWKHFEVQYVQAGTPAAKAGFKVGDVLKSINGVDVTCFDGLNAVRKLLCGEIGEKFELVVERTGSEMKLKLVLADLFAK
jgi:hypothetical protein